MAGPDHTREARAAARRATWTFALATGETSSPEASSAAERIAAVWAITCDAWALSGRPFPDYSRAEMPGRVWRRTEG